MRQSSEAFMNEMLKDNQTKNVDVLKDQADRIAKIIDDKMEEAMKRYTEQVSKVNPPASEVETPEKEVEDQITRPEENLVNETIDNLIENK